MEPWLFGVLQFCGSRDRFVGRFLICQSHPDSAVTENSSFMMGSIDGGVTLSVENTETVLDKLRYRIVTDSSPVTSMRSLLSVLSKYRFPLTPTAWPMCLSRSTPPFGFKWASTFPSVESSR